MRKHTWSQKQIDNLLIKLAKQLCLDKEHHKFITSINTEITVSLNFVIGCYYTYDHTQNHLVCTNVYYHQTSTDFDDILSTVNSKKILDKDPPIIQACYKNQIIQNKKIIGKNLYHSIALPLFDLQQLYSIFIFYSKDEISLSQNDLILLKKLKQHISDFMLLHKELLDYQHILKSTNQGIIRINPDNNITYINPAGSTLLGYTVNDLLGKPVNSIFPTDKNNSLANIKDGQLVEANFLHQENYEVPVRIHQKIIVEDDIYVGSIITFIDTTQEKIAKAELQRLAHHDVLTGLPNRRDFTQHLKHAVYRAKRTKTHIAVMFIDLDNFKKINDTLGHDVGDRLLQQLSSRLRYSVRTSDYIARLGGDEFAAIFEEFQSPETIGQLATKIKEILEKEVIIDSHSMTITMSIGIAVYPFAGNSENNLVKSADIAMYRAKKAGKDQYKFYTETLDQKIKRIHQIEQQLENAITTNQLYLYYQPIFSTKTKKLNTVEALIRWNNPLLNHPTPDEFIPIAEQSTLINQLGQWVLEQALKDIHELTKIDPFSDIKLSINISAKQILNQQFIPQMQDFASEVTDPSKFILEITETAVMEDINAIEKTLTKISKLGFQIAIDDFGTGYTSLIYLKQLPIDYLKIDKAFIHNLITDNNDRSIVTAIINLSKSLGFTCVAEGIENESQLDFLVQKECDYFQGYLYAKPMPLTDLIRKYRTQRTK